MSEPAKTKCILYARFSPRPNAEECESCESQLTDMKKYCSKRGYTVVAEYQDRALSGGDGWESRPGMFDAATACKRGCIFLVRNYHRLFRDTEKALVFRSMLERKGVEIRSIHEEAANGDSPMSKMIRGVLLLVAEYQREIIRATTRSKMLQHQANGRRMSLQPPYGWMVDPLNPKSLAVCGVEQEYIKIMRKLRSRGLSYRKICRELESRGIFPRSGAKKWCHAVVKKAIERPYGE